MKQLLRNIAVGALIASLVVAILQVDMTQELRIVMGWALTVILLLWVGIWGLSRLLDVRLPWSENTLRRFFIQLLLSTLYSLLVINLTYWMFMRIFQDVTPLMEQFLVLNVYGLILMAPIFSVNVVMFVMMKWKQSMLLSEKLKQENIQSRLESLRSHVDPHFLFNSLNILSSLIDKDADAAQDFLSSFSEVYRYVLKNKQEELVPLSRELQFIDAYVFMLRQRFRDQMQIEMDIPPAANRKMIPPMAVQMLVENAIKHNKASDKQPLLIRMYVEDGYLIVQNTYRPLAKKPAGANSGLDNLRKRYGYLSSRDIEILPIEDYFTVKIPLLEIE
ncbi:histidine kinase [Pontibacter sp. G13]|uniref:sensor histidine kinase n=1 Tax=Pontibacter sp. G13 TaxID=3074898 RepID=UPI00288A6A27|nr:histidine kinase [Pontibacter sp. G13]WNJ17287.1 histidine kinase [Pontibacter sp. G13]